jgi:nicotinamide mononucleotide adenylyltransferase
MLKESLKGVRVALLACGSFNPPTNSHLRMMELAKDFLEHECGCKVIEGILSPVADNFAKKDLLTAIHRYKMLEMATKFSTWMKADDWECTQSQWTRTLQVLKHYKEVLGKKYSDAEFRIILVCGGDVVDSFRRILPDGSNLWDPKDVEAIIRDFGIIILERTSATPAETLAQIPGAKIYAGNIASIIDEAFPNNVSSTKLRAALKRGYSIRYCTPDPVVDYILENKLYQ